MKITIAMDSFKGSCSSEQACSAIANGIKEVFPDCHIISAPISDGGDGFLDCLYPMLKQQGFIKDSCEVIGPYFNKVQANFLYKDNQAILEMAQCSGITLAPKGQLNGARATTYGLGQLVDHVIKLGCNHIMIGLGGSATNDAGVGFAQALGAKFYDQDGNLLEDILCADQLSSIAAIDSSVLDAKLAKVTIEGTCDVNNPLCGPNGATFIFGPQKGIAADKLATIDHKLKSFANIINSHYQCDALNVPGAGAAGGMGAALLWFTKGKLSPGIDVVMKLLLLEEHIKDSDLLIVGEGRMDGQSLQGKAPLGVAKLAASLNVPVIALCGSIGPQSQLLYDHHIHAMFSICNGPMSLDYSMEHVKELLQSTTINIMRLLTLKPQ